MSDIREMIDVRELDPVEMTGIVGGDEYFGTVAPGPPIPMPGGNPLFIVSPVNILQPGQTAGGTGVVVSGRREVQSGNRASGSVAGSPDSAGDAGLGFPNVSR